MRRRKIFKNEEEQSVSFFTNATWTRYGHSNISLPEDFYFRKKLTGEKRRTFLRIWFYVSQDAILILTWAQIKLCKR